MPIVILKTNKYCFFELPLNLHQNTIEMKRQNYTIILLPASFIVPYRKHPTSQDYMYNNLNF